MQVSIKKTVFLEKIATASKFISRKIGTPQTLQALYIQKEGGLLHIYTTNLSSYYHSAISTEKSDPFTILIDPKKVQEFLSLLEGEDITLDLRQKELLITQGKTRGLFPLYEAKDYPLPPKEKGTSMSLEKKLIEEDLPLVLFSSSRDSSRPVLSGINFTEYEGEMAAVATDGFRLSLLKMKKGTKIEKMLLPADFLYEIVQLTKNAKEVEFRFIEKEKIAAFFIDGDSYFTRLIDGEFPPFEKVVPVETNTTVTLEVQDLLRGVKLVAVFAREQSNIVLCNFSKEGLVLSPKTGTGGENSTQVDIEIKGGNQKVAFNYKFLIELLNNIEGKKITIEILRPDAPVVFKAAKENFFHIIMPVRIQE